MDPQDVIASYVADVSGRLPRWKRLDVAVELKELLTESLYARAEEAGRPADEVLALAMVREFGRPAEVAARYHPPFAIIEPTDTRNFLLASIIGSIALVAFGLPGAIADKADNNIEVMWWWGVMVLVFGAKGFIDRASGEKKPWMPRQVRATRFGFETLEANRFGSLMTILITLGVMALYCWPRATADLFIDADVSGLAYTQSFAGGLRMQWLVGVLACYVVLYGVVLVHGRWNRITRFLDIAVMFHIALQLGWHAKVGHILVSPHLDQIARNFMGAFSVALLLTCAAKTYFYWESLPPKPGGLRTT